MRRTLILLVFLLAVGTASAQDKMIAIKGTVTDAKSKEPLPGVTVYVLNGYHYTQTNGDGAFVIKVPEKMTGGNLVFSLFGYDRDTLAVRQVQKSPKVRLREGGSIKLSEVVISEYTPQSLVKEAVKRIPQNFWTDTTVGTYFYRDVRQLEDSLYLFDEMVFDALRVGYDKHNTTTKLANDWRHPEARPIESNYKAILFSRLLVNDTAYINEITGGTGSSYLEYSDNAVLFDPAEIPNTTFYLSGKKSRQKVWDYRMETFADADGAEYYYLTLTKSNTLLGNAFDTVWLTIAKGNLALTKVETVNNTHLTSIPWPFNKLAEKVGFDSIYWNNHNVYNYGEVDGRLTLTSYTKHQQSTYFFSEAGTGSGKREQHYTLDAQCVLTSQRRGDASFFDGNNIQSPVRVAVSDRQAGQLRYDEDFWSQYNFVPLEEALLEKLERKLGTK